MGGEVTAHTTRDYTAFELVVAAPDAARALALLPALARPPAVDRASVRGEREIVGHELRERARPADALWDLLLRARDVEVDVLPATVPVDYQADAFLAIHADGDARDAVRGFKLARSPLSKIPAWDDALVGWLYAEYARVTGLPRDDEHVTRNMEYYYAFNNRRYYYAIAPSTPAAILEAGLLTSAADRTVLVTDPDRAAGGIAAGLLGFIDIQR